MVFGCSPPENGRIVRNLIQAANYIMSHITHFHLLSGLDFVDVAALTAYQGERSGAAGAAKLG
jgi:Ni,Fe-hydrogenase I large subunit